ncbi:hypothetical protein EDD37DRAFT_644416 [Exophiala viscosa]|uniref:uncharacterized protein n=1 Tax=Exophiala viscosa TaxID=2486360 RepID=UPI002199F354|nr:hypothetical protein EDD37DRAFT_644416 [Exophiala viscosa]
MAMFMLQGGEDQTQSAIAKRRARNRISQKSFRDRQARYLKDLERKVAESWQDESARLKPSHDECQRLREQVTAAQRRIDRLVSCLSGLATDIAQTIGTTVENHTDPRPEASATMEDRASETVSSSLNSESLANLPTSTSQSSHYGTDPSPQTAGSDAGGLRDSMATMEDVLVAEDFALDLGHQPQDDWTQFEQDTSHALDIQSLFTSVGTCPPAMDTTNLFQTSDLPHPVHENQVSLQWLGPNDSADVLCAPTSGPWPPRILPRSDEGNHDQYRMKQIYPPGTPSFPSTFSAHLAVCEFFAKHNQAYKDRRQSGGKEAFAKLVTTMVHSFVDTCWPENRTWWTYFQSSRVVEKLLCWKLDQCLETYQAIPSTHRPTALQMCTAHPAVIDWVFFPSVRDKLIELYSQSWQLDDLLRELVKAYVVETDLDNIITDIEHFPSRRGYFHVWDIVQTISRRDHLVSGSATGPSTTTAWFGHETCDDSDVFEGDANPFGTETPSQDEQCTRMSLEDIFHNPQTALRLFRLLRMDDRRAMKLDPLFATAHPELCDDPSIIARGIDCTLRGYAGEVPGPKALSRKAILNYKMILGKTDMGANGGAE